MSWKANNWADHPELRRQVTWRANAGQAAHLYVAEVNGEPWAVRMNDFPDEPLYTLLVNSAEVIHFDDWPDWWERPPRVAEP